ncbi:MAG: malonyl-[acyl-carrier protein] O-methyltransferase BioC [Sphingobacteriia bacterium]|nr:malonyl-[acyl-carrier protein] O-methyltransferase BioC [Sphingobacteriia bacterium]NCC37930.1 malonyl-[acyl-carrier protein] O-methyltransferase BioC [Gammaproteobacteria bacterium]
MIRIDKRRARRNFEQAAERYDSVAILQREIADRLIERLDYVRIQPRLVLDLGAGTGYGIDLLRRRYRRARVIALDFAHPMLLRARRRGGWLARPLCVCADAESLPLADGSIDLIVSNATLQWCNDLDRTFAECLRVLRPGGLLLFNTFGPDTLKELRSAWSQVDAASHVSPFIDMHDIGDALVRARFADPVMDAEQMILTYSEVGALMADLKILGASNATAERSRGLTGRARLAALSEAYECHRRDGRLPATYEVVYGLAWVPEQKPISDGVAVPISAIQRRAGSSERA